jgi:hypothetical protein
MKHICFSSSLFSDMHSWLYNKFYFRKKNGGYNSLDWITAVNFLFLVEISFFYIHIYERMYTRTTHLGITFFFFSFWSCWIDELFQYRVLSLFVVVCVLFAVWNIWIERAESDAVSALFRANFSLSKYLLYYRRGKKIGEV